MWVNHSAMKSCDRKLHCLVLRVHGKGSVLLKGDERNAPLAQLVEQLTLNQWVPGSNP